MTEPTLLGTDWRNLEGRLTAYFSGDQALLTALEAELHGGPKVHSINAGIIYGVAPEDAATHMVNLQGARKTAYDGGKRLTHAWNYGMEPFEMAKQFWIDRAEAEAIHERLSNAYQRVVAWRTALADYVFGRVNLTCPRCDYSTNDTNERSCPECAPKRRTPWQPRSAPPRLRWNGYSLQPHRVLYTPFGRRRIYLGRRNQSANALTAQLPQSTGASMWYRTLNALTQLTRPDATTLEDLIRPRINTVYTGTYDSFLIGITGANDPIIPKVIEHMERPWTELPLIIPCDEHLVTGRSNDCPNCTPYQNDRGGSHFYCPSDHATGTNWKEVS